MSIRSKLKKYIFYIQLPLVAWGHFFVLTLTSPKPGGGTQNFQINFVISFYYYMLINFTPSPIVPIISYFIKFQKFRFLMTFWLDFKCVTECKISRSFLHNFKLAIFRPKIGLFENFKGLYSLESFFWHDCIIFFHDFEFWGVDIDL